MVVLNEDQLSQSSLSSFLTFDFEPVGKWYEIYNFQKHQGDVEIEEDSDSEASEGSDNEEDNDAEYEEFVKTLDPKEWKDQDHYKVLGLEKLRFKATQHQIKRAHKKKVLKYHPDKAKQSGQTSLVLDGEFFTCITKAFDTLTDPIKRRSFDSVDPTFDDDVPPVSEKSKNNFYQVFVPVFAENARWSIKKPVPQLGDENSSFDDVNDFYAFWYDFDSWREFSYLDEENKESAQDRDERRWIDKQNKSARLKRKKEETTRLRQLVDNAYACDPRILKFRQDEKRKKEEEKLKRKEAIKQKEDEEKRKLEEARLAKEKIEEQERLKIEAEKRERDQQKKALKKERKNLRTFVKDKNYFATNDDEKVKLMDDIERLVDLLTLQEIQALNESLEKSVKQESVGRDLILNMLHDMNIRLDEERHQTIAQQNGSKAAAAVVVETKTSVEWEDDEIKLLVKACKVIAVGTRDRWDVIANFIEEHSRGKYKRTGKEVLNKTKEIQNNPSMKDEANKKAFEKTLQTIKVDVTVKDKPSERYGSAGEQLLADTGSNPAPWSPEEQKVLEQALKSFPASLADRWDKIAECIPTRSKKDCIVRYKELVETIQAKKRAQEKVQKKT